jgi:hypothetical protein
MYYLQRKKVMEPYLSLRHTLLEKSLSVEEKRLALEEKRLGLEKERVIKASAFVSSIEKIEKAITSYLSGETM